MSKDNKNPYLSGEQPKDTIDYRMILEEQRARREREALKPGKQSMVINREALGLPPLDPPKNGERESRFKFDINKDIKQNVDLSNLGTGEDKYSANYRPQKENIGSKNMYDALAQTRNVTQEEVLALFGVDEARRSPDRKAPVSHPKRSIEERRAELDSMLPDQSQITLEGIMRERQKNQLPNPSLLAEEQVEVPEEEPIADIEMIDVVTPLRENLDMPGFEYRQRYLRNGLDPQQNEEFPQREGFGGSGGRLPEFESETKNWSDRAADELFAPIEHKRTVIYPMEDSVEELPRAPRKTSARRRSILQTQAEQPRELTRQEIIAQSHAVRRKDRAKRRTAIGGYMPNPIPNEMDAERAYSAGRSNAAYLSDQDAELARKHAEIAHAMDIMEGIGEEPIDNAQPAQFDGFGGLDEMTNISPTFAVPMDIAPENQESYPNEPYPQQEYPYNNAPILQEEPVNTPPVNQGPAVAPGKKSMFSYLFNDDEPLPDTFSDYTKYVQPRDDGASPSYGYLYVNDDDIRKQASMAEESFEMEEEPINEFFGSLDETFSTPPKPMPKQQQPSKPGNTGVRKVDKQLDFDIPLEKQVQSTPNMRPKNFTEVIDGQEDESGFGSFDNDLDAFFNNNGGSFGNIMEEPPVETASEDETDTPVTSESPSDNLWDEIAKERKGGSAEMKKKIIEFTGEMVDRGNEAAVKIKEQLEEKLAEHKQQASQNEERDSDVDAVKIEKAEAEETRSEYTDPSQADEIKGEMLDKLSELIFRGSANLIFFIVLLIIEALPSFGINLPYISLNLSPTHYYAINIAITLFIIGTNYIVPYHSVKNLTKKRIDGSFGFVVASAAALIQNLGMIFGGTLRSYSIVLAFAYLINTVGEFINITRIGKNFAFVSSKKPKGAVMLADDNVVLDENSDQLSAAYSIKTKFLSDFLSFAYEEDPGEISSARIAPFFAAASAVVGILAGIISRDIFTGLSAFTAACVISIPMTRLICTNLPLLMKVKELKQSGAMLSGWAAVDEFSDVNVLSVDDKMLFPPSNISIRSIRVFDQSKKTVAAKTAAAILSTFGGSLSHKFLEIIGNETDDLPHVTDLEHLDSMGFSGKLDGEDVALGTIDILNHFDIELPELDYEHLFRNTNSVLLYLAIGGKLSTMFIIVYKGDKKTSAALKELEEAGVKLSVKTFDPIINQKRIAEKFGVSERFATIVNDYFDNSSSVYNVTCETAPAVIGTNRTLAGAAKGISAAVTLKNSIAISVILQTIGCILGFVLVAVFACSGISTMISPLKLIAYTILWIIAVIITPITAIRSTKHKDKKIKNRRQKNG